MDEAQALFTPDVIDLFVTPFATKPGAPIFEGAIGAVNAGDKTVKERQLIDQDIVASIWRESRAWRTSPSACSTPPAAPSTATRWRLQRKPSRDVRQDVPHDDGDRRHDLGREEHP